MKILIVNTYYYPDIIGGAEISVQKLAEGLAQRGIKVEVLCTGTSDTSEVISGVTIHRIKLNNIFQPIELRNSSNTKKIISRGIDVYNIANKNKLTKIIKEINPELIHVNNIYGISPIIWTVAKKLNIPVVQTLRDYYLTCPRINMMKNGVPCTKRSVGCNIFSSFNNILSKDIECVTAPSQYTLDTFGEIGFFKNSKKYKVFNAIDFEIDKINKIYEAKKKKLKVKDHINFIFTGTLSEYKGLGILIDAFKKIDNNNITLFIAGKGPMENIVQEECTMDKRIRYLGFLNELELNKVLKDCDVLIAPSIWNEPFGRVVIDAYKNGLPVIVSNNGGLKEIVENNATGIQINTTVDELVGALKYFMQVENILKMLDNCKIQLNKFSIEHQIDQFIKIYKKTIRKNKMEDL